MHTHAFAVSLAVSTLLGCAATAPANETAPETTPLEVAPNHTLSDQPAGTTPDIRDAISFARDKVAPALVHIRVVSYSYYGGKENKSQSVGSGTIFSPEGYIVTNAHVVNDGREFKVTLADKREIPAKLIGEDPMTDLAVLKIDPNETGPLQNASFTTSDNLQVGDYVLAMGSPFALSRSVTLGIVSNTERVFTSSSGDDLADQEFDFNSSPEVFTQWIQHDALINPGNSGGPLVNMKGELVGVNARGGAGMSFAIPAALARNITSRIIKDGEVIRSTLGISLKSIKRSGYDDGILVNSVDDDSPAAKAGIHAGDVIVKLNDQPVSARFPEQIPAVARAIADSPVGSTINLVVLRDHDELSVSATTERLLRNDPDEAALRLFGLSASQITDQIVRAWRLDSNKGALVRGVTSGGPAGLAEPSLSYGDIIRSIASKPVDSLKDLLDIYKDIANQDPLPEYVLVEFERRGSNQITLLKPRRDKPHDPPREIPKAWIGVATQPILRTLAEQLGDKDLVGFRVTRVYPKTDAATAGLMVGDIITAINGDRLNPRGMQDAGMFQRQIRKLNIGEDANLTLTREGESIAVNVPLERTRIGEDEALRDTNKDFELTVRELTFFDRDENRWDDTIQGVIVVNADNAGWAGTAGIFMGDLIQRINNTEITDIKSYRDAMDVIAKDQPERVTFVVLRGQRTQFKFAEPSWKPKTAEETAKEAPKP
ncbi:MAG: PDZ domain-containing protein [Phycisphaerales bacterium]|nr:MAG: PDZ domain-containing protein [Phycisphaerales bacterium]